MKTAEAFAPAKINLTLHVTGVRSDGYHLLDSLVVFVDIGDRVCVREAAETALILRGPEASGLVMEADNLVSRAARLVSPDLVAEITLEKNLPVSSGIGGGSSDAVATLRALAELTGCRVPDAGACLALGADVPVCLNPVPQRMAGIGEELSPVASVPDAGVLLVNPRRAVSTPEIFKALSNKTNPPMEATLPRWQNLRDFTDWLRQHRNDLQAPAEARLPEIGSACRALEDAGALVARMSGSGATCFGLFATKRDAMDASEKLGETLPDWWIEAGQILT